jgi:transposase
MGYGHPLALRSRIIDAVTAGAAAREAARRFAVSPYQCDQFGSALARDGELRAWPDRWPEEAEKLAGREDWLHAVMASEPDITLAELQKRLAGEGVDISRQAINTTLRALGYSYKKTTPAAEQERRDVARKRHHWRNWQTRMRPERLVFIDETGAKTNMARLRGRSPPRGRRLNATLPARS